MVLTALHLDVLGGILLVEMIVQSTDRHGVHVGNDRSKIASSTTQRFIISGDVDHHDLPAAPLVCPDSCLDPQYFWCQLEFPIRDMFIELNIFTVRAKGNNERIHAKPPRFDVPLS